jgi:hypothetical protein
MLNSIVSYPERGPWGRASYRGNTSGYLVRDLLSFFRPSFFVDPAEGSGTSRDVAQELGVKYTGLDLHSGFNLLRDSLSQRLEGLTPDFVFFHPPYHDIIRYSGEQWGGEAHPDDLSRCASYEEFLIKLRSALNNIYEALAGNGRYSVLVGDVRRQGQYFSLQADLWQLAPGVGEGVIIRQQHNMVSNRTNYSGKFIPIVHEYVLTFRKDRLLFGLLDVALEVSQRLERLSQANWRGTILKALQSLGGAAALPAIYEAIERDAPDKTKPRPNWQARVRAELQKHFVAVERGVWALPVTVGREVV